LSFFLQQIEKNKFALLIVGSMVCCWPWAPRSRGRTWRQ